MIAAEQEAERQADMELVSGAMRRAAEEEAREMELKEQRRLQEQQYR